LQSSTQPARLKIRPLLQCKHSESRTRTNLSPRADFQLTPGNTLSARYQYYRDTWQNDGVGGQTLPQAGYDSFSTEHTVQIIDTQTLGTKGVNETRFQYLRDNDTQNPLSTAIGINVLGAFTGGGSRKANRPTIKSLRIPELHLVVRG